MNVFFHSMNVARAMVIQRGGGDTLTLHVIIFLNFVLHLELVGAHKPRFELSSYPCEVM